MRKLICVLGLFASIGCFAQSNIVGSAPQVDSIGLEYSKAAIAVFKHLDKLNNEIFEIGGDDLPFRELFSDSALIVNEVLPANNLAGRVSVSEFIDYYYEHFNYLVSAEIRPYDIILSRETSKSFIFEVFAKRNLNEFQSNELDFYKADMDVVYTIEYSREDTALKILSIRNIGGSPKFLTVKLAAGRDNNLLNDIRFLNRNNTLIPVSEVDRSLVFSVKKDFFEYEVSPQSMKYIGSLNIAGNSNNLGSNGRLNDQKVFLRIRPKHFFIEAGVGYSSLNNNFSIAKNELDAHEDMQLLESSFGLGFIQKVGAMNLGISSVVTQQSMEGSYVLQFHSGSFENIDRDGESYEHLIELSGIKEDVRLNSSLIGVELFFGYELTNRIEAIFSYAYQSAIETQGNYSVKAVADYYGYYPEYELSLFNLGDYGFYSDVPLSSDKNALNLKQGIGRQVLGSGIKYDLTRRVSIAVEGSWSVQAVYFKYSDDNILSSARGRSDASVAQLSADRTWQYLSYFVGLKYYL